MRAVDLNPTKPSKGTDMSMQFYSSKARTLEGVFAGIVFFSTTVLFMGTTIAEVFGRGLVA